MAKPSIFSKEYKKRMRRVKRRNTLIFFIAILLAASTFVYLKYNKNMKFTNFKSYVSSIINKKNVNNDKKKASPSSNKQATASSNKQTTPKPEDTKTEEKSYSFKLSDGKELNAVYEEVNGEKKFKYINGADEKLYYNINPSSTGIVIYDSVPQSIIYIDINGNVSDITNKMYISSDNTRFLKEDVLKNNPNYVWASSPKFIDNDNIAYVSQLPWFNKAGKKYLWIVNVNRAQSHQFYLNIEGDTIEFDKITADGLLTIIIDGKTKHINANGDLSD